MKIPEREGLRVEFKQEEVLKEPARVARSVASFLNADGGELWIGIAEQAGGVERKPIENVEAAARALQDTLISRIEPSPTSREVEVVVHEGLLVVKVQEGLRGPYAYLEKSLRGYVTRVAAVTRFLTTEELRAAFNRRGRGQSDQNPAHVWVTRRSGEFKSRPALGLWLASSPAVELDLRSQEVQQLVRDPVLSGTRRLGWSFTTEFHTVSPVRSGRLVSSSPNGSRFELHEGGMFSFETPLDTFVFRGDPRELHPWALSETVVSVFRLFQKLLGTQPRTPERTWAALSLVGAEGWTLRSGSAADLVRWHNPPQAAECDIVLSAIPFNRDGLSESPDRCGWRLLERVYDHFGFGPESMPPEFDRRTGRFTIQG